jgi:hypothetical protein
VVGADTDDELGTSAGAAYLYFTPLFVDDFESGDGTAWSLVVNP